MDFSEIFKELRKEKGLSAVDVANSLGFSKNIIYEWEHGRCEPNIFVLRKIAALFEVTVDYLIGNSDDFGIVNIVANSELTEDEKAIIKKYRALSLFQQEAIRIQLDAMSEKVTR